MDPWARLGIITSVIPRLHPPKVTLRGPRCYYAVSVSGREKTSVARNCLRALRIVIVAAILLGTTAQAAFAYSSYKGFYGGYCASYAARQFDKAAPSPGITWRGNAKTWYSRAAAAKWQVTRRTGSAIPGSIIVWNDRRSGHVGVVRRVTAKYVYGEEMNWNRFGRVNRFKLRRDRLDRGRYKFTGFVLPKRKS